MKATQFLRNAVLAALIVSTFDCSGISRPIQGRQKDVITVTVFGNGQKVTIARPGLYDLEVSGDGNSVRISSESSVRLMSVSGVNHQIVVSPGALVRSVRVSGVGSTIRLPNNVHPQISNSGDHNRIVVDPPKSADIPDAADRPLSDSDKGR